MREHPRAKHYSSARDARLRAKLCTMPLLRHAHNPMVAVFRISRASRRKRRSCQESRFVTTAYPSRGREHEREIPHHRKFNLDAWNKMVQKKIVAISFEEGVVFRVEDQLFKNSLHRATTPGRAVISWYWSIFHYSPRLFHLFFQEHVVVQTNWAHPRAIILEVFRARVFARTLLFVFVVTSTRMLFLLVFSNYVEDYC